MQQDLSAKLEQRLGRVHARQRLGIEKDYEQRVFGHGINFFHIENWYSIHSVIRNSLKLAGLYWRGCKNAEGVRIRHNLILRADIPTLFDGFTILHISDMHADISQGANKGCPSAHLRPQSRGRENRLPKILFASKGVPFASISRNTSV
jgi:uncharacterized protein